MSILTDLQEASAAQSVAIANLTTRIDAIPTGGVDGGEVAKVTADIHANNAKIDQLAVPKP